MKAIGIFLIIFGTILFVVGAWALIYCMINSEVRETDCFDKYNNEIVGATCLDEDYCPYFEWAILILLGVTIGFLGGFMLND